MKYLNILLALVISSPGVVSSASAYTGENLAMTAKITMEQAIEVAQRARPGKIAHKELERERGGSGLRYSFDVLSRGVTYEVGVDAQTGKLLENAHESNRRD